MGLLLAMVGSMVGLVVSLLLSVRHMGLAGGGLVCGDGGGCEAVLASKYAVIGLGAWGEVPLAYAGVMYYAVMMAGISWALASGSRVGRLGLVGVAGVGAAVSVGLMVLQAVVIRAFCPFCLVSAVSSWVVLGGAVLAWRRADGRGRPVLAAALSAGVIPVLALAGVGVMLGHAGESGSEELLGRFDGVPIRLSDLRADEPSLIEDAEASVYSGKLRYVHRKLASMAIEREAAKRGISPEELIHLEVRVPTSRQASTQPDMDAGELYRQRWELWTSGLLEQHKAEVLVTPPAWGKLDVLEDLGIWEHGDGSGVKVAVFSDLECPVCAMLDERLAGLARRFEGKISVLYRHFPLRGHPLAEDAAVLAEWVARDKGAAGFRVYKAAVYGEVGRLTRDSMLAAAERAGVSASEAESAWGNEGLRNKVRASAADARAMRLDGAPVLTINGKRMPAGLSEEGIEREIRRAVEESSEGRVTVR